ncbi:hypothetical protein [Rhodoplanes azumiensis]|uniref:Uncharacterized protein n=1 Tax=Rhodoplanes azumiensis TaxID=1897628 RepID=A0ABW5AQ16_9BRAD
MVGIAIGIRYRIGYRIWYRDISIAISRTDIESRYREPRSKAISRIEIDVSTAGRRAMTAAARRADCVGRRSVAARIGAAARACVALLVVALAIWIGAGIGTETGVGALAQTGPAAQDKAAQDKSAPDKPPQDKPAPETSPPNNPAQDRPGGDRPARPGAGRDGAGRDGIGRDGATPDKTVTRRAKGPPGKDIRIAVYVNVKPDCSSGPMPTIRLVGAPAHGTVTLRKATIKATNVRECLALEVPGFIALYRSRPGFAGADSVSLEVRFPDKPPQIHEIAITIADGVERI